MTIAWLPLVVALVSEFNSAEATLPADTIRERHERLHTRWASQVEQLASKCEAQGQTEAAESIRKALRPATEETELLVIPILPTGGQSAPPAGTGGARAEWLVALGRLNKQYAKELLDLASAAYRDGEVSYCYDLVREVVDHDPDYGPARALMGYTKYRDQWVTQFAAGKLKSGQIWNPRFGWIGKTQLPHYENGEQLWKGQWLPAEEVAKHRQQWANAWEIETDHYIVRTNVSLERGVAFAAKLEKLYAIFFRLFADFFSPREQMAMLFDPPNRRTASATKDDPGRRQQKNKFRVNFYRTREEYMDVLRPLVKTGLEGSTGMYLTGTHIAYFYAHEQMDESTVIHEATHQLFSETREHRNGDGSRGNYWVLEGVACYMESFHDRGDHVELGSWDTPRLKRGRERLQKFVPVEKLIQLGMKDFDGPEVYDLYMESACLCHFLIHRDNGRYGAAFVKYLEEVYMGRADLNTFAQLFEVDTATLDRQFREHVAEGKYR